MEKINAAGLACPMPVVMAKKYIDVHDDDFVITVDNAIAVENLKKLAQSQQYHIDVQEMENLFDVYFSKNGIIDRKSSKMTTGDWVVFMGKDTIGEGEHELGSTLAKMFFYTLCESDDLPSAILFMNQGVKLPTQDEQIVEHLKNLQIKGVNILVCGTCLDYYGLTDDLKAGTISNMYDIVTCMQEAKKVLTL